MKPQPKQPITCEICGKQATCTCAFVADTVNYVTRKGICKVCAAKEKASGIHSTDTGVK